MTRALLASSIIAILSITSFLPMAQAANKASRFRGFDYSDFSTFKEEVSKKNKKNQIGIQRRLREVFTNRSLKRQTFSNEKRSGSGIRFSNRERKTNRGTTRTAATDIYKAQSYGFDVLLPASFTVLNDTITGKQGTFHLGAGNSEVFIMATDQTCSGSVFATQKCLKDGVEKLIEKDAIAITKQQRKSNRAILLDPQVTTQIQSKQRAWLQEYENNEGGNRLYLVFTNPTTNTLWEMIVIDTDNVILNNNYLKTVLINSLSGTSKITDKKASNTYQYTRTKNTRQRAGGFSTQRDATFAVSPLTLESEDFTLKAGQGFVVSEDLLATENKALLENALTADKITINIDRDTNCKASSTRVLRNCLEATAKAANTNFTNELEATVLDEKNIKMELLNTAAISEDLNRTQSSATNLGRMILLFKGDARFLQVIFPHPETGEIWNVQLHSQSGKNLEQDTQIRRFISSFKFN